jgi:hypothetical protein
VPIIVLEIHNKKYFKGLHKKENLTRWKFSKDLFNKTGQNREKQRRKSRVSPKIYRQWELKRLKMGSLSWVYLFILSELGDFILNPHLHM